MSRFDYVKYDETSQVVQDHLKKLFTELDGILDLLPDGRAKALCVTKLEESYMWAGKSLRDGQVKRNGSAPLQEERKNG